MCYLCIGFFSMPHNNYLTETTDENITLVFENLFRGSKNHLWAFNKNLKHLGVNYEPPFIDSAYFDDIMNSSIQPGEKTAQNRVKKEKDNVFFVFSKF